MATTRAVPLVWRHDAPVEGVHRLVWDPAESPNFVDAYREPHRKWHFWRIRSFVFLTTAVDLFRRRGTHGVRRRASSREAPMEAKASPRRGSYRTGV